MHLINGLPLEIDADMLETARGIGRLRPDAVKIHLLHILRDTPLEQLWKAGKLQPLSMQEYVQITAAQLSPLPPSQKIQPPVPIVPSILGQVQPMSNTAFCTGLPNVC